MTTVRDSDERSAFGAPLSEKFEAAPGEIEVMVLISQESAARPLLGEAAPGAAHPASVKRQTKLTVIVKAGAGAVAAVEISIYSCVKELSEPVVRTSRGQLRLAVRPEQFLGSPRLYLRKDIRTPRTPVSVCCAVKVAAGARFRVAPERVPTTVAGAAMLTEPETRLLKSSLKLMFSPLGDGVTTTSRTWLDTSGRPGVCPTAVSE
jgi:hypothetical protein